MKLKEKIKAPNFKLPSTDNTIFELSKVKKKNIIFAGIDLVANYLTGDINITSPTGLKNFKDLTGKNLAIDFWNYVEKKVN